MELKLSTGILAVLLLTGCGNYQETNGGSQDSYMGYQTLSFAAVQAIVFKQSCYGCHTNATGNSGNVNLETYANVITNLQSIRSEVLSNSMPKSGPPVSDLGKRVLFAWITAGAPQTSQLPMPDPNTPLPAPPPPPPPGFDAVSAQIFQPYCVRCHSNFNDYSQVTAEIAQIQSDIVSNTMPNATSPLAASLKSLLNSWVQAGEPMGFTYVEQQVFTPYCVRCHSSFAKYSAVAQEITDISNMLATDKMPKGGPPLPDNLKAIVNQWISQGLPN